MHFAWSLLAPLLTAATKAVKPNDMAVTPKTGKNGRVAVLPDDPKAMDPIRQRLPKEREDHSGEEQIGRELPESTTLAMVRAQWFFDNRTNSKYE